MSSQQTVFTRLKDPPQNDSHPLRYPTRPIYCSIFNGNHIILTNNIKKCLILYNLDTQKIVKIYKYPISIDHPVLSSCVDHENNIVYLPCEEFNKSLSLNLEENRWNIFPKKTGLRILNCHFIPSPFNELRLVTNDNQYKYVFTIFCVFIEKFVFGEYRLNG